MSDLHLEFGTGYNSFHIRPGAPYLCLLGDIGLAIHEEKLLRFLERQLESFKIVFFLLGNHEAYSSSYPFAKSLFTSFRQQCEEKRKVDKSLGEFVFLDQTRYDVDDNVTILGCTLYSNVIPEQYQDVRLSLNDFYEIKDWSVEKHNAAHESDVKWLREQLAQLHDKEPERRVMILTHHSPTLVPEANDPRHRNSPLTSAFCTDLVPGGQLNLQQVKVWAYGHTHFNSDVKIEGTRLYSNQRGYISSGFSPDFDAENLVEM